MNGSIEQKYIFMEQHREGILEWLLHSSIPDSQFHYGSVSSIYYDTPSLDFYDEKRNSDYLKSKVRLRWYSDGPGSISDSQMKCYLELKTKTGILRQKNRIELFLPSKILNGDPLSEEEIEKIPLRIHELSYAPPGFLVPTILIQYFRHRFFDPETGSRISLDGNIHCPQANSQYIHGFPPVHLDVGVLEIKGTHRHLPRSLNGISPYITRDAFSKYARCCEHLMQPLSRRI